MKNVPSVIFAALSTTSIMSVAIFLMGLSIGETILILIGFIGGRYYFGDFKHYKNPINCLLGCLCVFSSLFLVVLTSDVIIGIVFSVFISFLNSGKADIDDMFLFTNKSKYKVLDDFLKSNSNDLRVVKFETYLRGYDELLYKLYDLRFKQFLTWKEINEKTNIYDDKKLNTKLDIIYNMLKYSLEL